MHIVLRMFGGRILARESHVIQLANDTNVLCIFGHLRACIQNVEYVCVWIELVCEYGMHTWATDAGLSTRLSTGLYRRRTQNIAPYWLCVGGIRGQAYSLASHMNGLRLCCSLPFSLSGWLYSVQCLFHIRAHPFHMHNIRWYVSLKYLLLSMHACIACALRCWLYNGIFFFCGFWALVEFSQRLVCRRFVRICCDAADATADDAALAWAYLPVYVYHWVFHKLNSIYIQMLNLQSLERWRLNISTYFIYELLNGFISAPNLLSFFLSLWKELYIPNFKSHGIFRLMSATTNYMHVTNQLNEYVYNKLISLFHIVNRNTFREIWSLLCLCILQIVSK